MNIKRELTDLENTCMKHFEEICIDDSKRICVFTITLENYDIWGGLGEHNTTETIYITKDGWLSEIITMETGLYQQKNPVKKKSSKRLSSEDVEKIINGNKTTVNDLIDLINLYQNIRKQFICEFKIY